MSEQALLRSQSGPGAGVPLSVAVEYTFIQNRFHPMTFSTNNGFIQKITCGAINIVRVCVKASPAEGWQCSTRSVEGRKDGFRV